MPETLPPATGADRRNGRRHGKPAAPGGGSVRALNLWISLLPAVVMALISAAAIVLLHNAYTDGSPIAVVIGVATAAVVLVLVGAGFGAESATRRVNARVDGLRSAHAHGQEDLRQLVDRVRAGERLTPAGGEVPPPEAHDPFSLLAYELRRDQHATQQALLQVTSQMASQVASQMANQVAYQQVTAVPAGGEAEQRVEVFVNLARRMQSLVHREIGLLDELEAQVEDPDLLKGLFTVDHLATRMRRQSESLAVLGGASSRRQWSRPVSMYEVLRSAVAEVEHYSRVKVMPQIEGTLEGNAVADIIHLIAELVENATKFSPPQTEVLLRATNVAAGLAIEVDDRGLGIPAHDQQRINDLLADPSRINIGELLQDGRIGLFVVATLARRHGVMVQLQANIYGGTRAIVVVPLGLVGRAPGNDASGASGTAGTAGTASGGPARAAGPADQAYRGPAQVTPALPARQAGHQPVQAGHQPAQVTSQAGHQPAGHAGPGAQQPAQAGRPPLQATAQQPAQAHHSGQSAHQGTHHAAPAATPRSPEQMAERMAQRMGESPVTSVGRRAAPDRGQVPQQNPQHGPQRTPQQAPQQAPQHGVQHGPHPGAQHSAPAPAPAPAPGTPGGPTSVPGAFGADAQAHQRPTGERPPLPQRRAQTHLVPELREARQTARTDEGGNHSPNLMAAFRGGLRRSEQESDDPADSTGDTGGTSGTSGTDSTS